MLSARKNMDVVDAYTRVWGRIGVPPVSVRGGPEDGEAQGARP